MSETLAEQDHEFASMLFLGFANETQGEWSSLDKGEIDQDFWRPGWPNRNSILRIVEGSCPSVAVSAYGHAVYVDWYKEVDPPEDVYLDSRVFDEVDLSDVLAEAAWCAIDDGDGSKALPFLRSALTYLDFHNFSGIEARKHLALALASNNYSVIHEYVDFINNRTVKGPDDAKEFMKLMAHGVAAVKENRLYTANGQGLYPNEKQALLETIGQAWIRKSMPIAEIDWLP